MGLVQGTSVASPTIAMVAGEASGVLLAGLLLGGLKNRWPDLLSHGIGGPHMQRHSGTTFMTRMLQSNMDKARVNVTDTFCNYKHKYQAQGPDCPPLDSTLVVIMFR